VEIRRFRIFLTDCEFLRVSSIHFHWSDGDGAFDLLWKKQKKRLSKLFFRIRH